MKATREDIDSLLDERPRKLSPEEVDYKAAPEGSVIRCASCINLYQRAIDAHRVCQIVRSDEIDKEGIDPSFRCDWWTQDNFVYPLTEESATEIPAE